MFRYAMNFALGFIIGVFNLMRSSCSFTRVC
jgi:hypothetical protein